jgi:ribosomal protein S21
LTWEPLRVRGPVDGRESAFKTRPPVFFHRRAQDNPVVFVKGGDVEMAIRLLKRRVQNYGGLKALRFRQQHPGRKDRKRFKARKAARQFIRAEKIKGLKEID